jgi:hypothetical protein
VGKPRNKLARDSVNWMSTDEAQDEKR